MHPLNRCNTPEAMIGEVDPKFILSEKSRVYNAVLSCYPSFKTSECQPSKKVERHSAHCFAALNLYFFQ